MIVLSLLFLGAGLVLASGGDNSTANGAEELILQPKDYLRKFHAALKRHQNNAANDADPDLVEEPRTRIQELNAALKKQRQESNSKVNEYARMYPSYNCTKKQTKVYLALGDVAILTSKNYPNVYPKNTKCKWKFTTDKDVTLWTFCGEDFNLEPKNKKGKCFDYLQLNKDKFCGTDNPTFFSTLDKMSVKFKSNKRNSDYTGFYCEVYAFNVFYTTSATTSVTPKPGSTPEPPKPGSTPEPPKPGSTPKPPKPGSTPKPGSLKCGVPNRVSRIVGGVETTVNEYPWQAAMVYTGGSSSFCGGSVISTKYVITAAHCTQATKDYSIDYDVLLGAHCLSSPASSQMRFIPKRYIQHGQYNDITMDNDISIIILKTAINFETSEIRPICLPPKTAGDFKDAAASVSGWGALVESGSGPDCLNEVVVPVISNTKCQNDNSQATITTNMICAGYDNGEKDSCQGDSGGPLFFNSGCGYEQIGVVSFGYGCAQPKQPGVYARVTEYIDWISSKLGGSPTYSCR